METSSCTTVAEEHVECIAAALPGVAHHLTNYTYEKGLLGLCLYYCYYARYTGDDRHYQTAEQYLDRALALVDPKNFRRAYRTDSLDGHLANLGRFLEFARRHEFLDMDTNHYLKNTDEVLFELMLSKIRVRNVDLGNGAMTAGHYFLSRLPSNPAAATCLEQLVSGLEETAEADAGGGYYWPIPTLENRIYFGISHGSAMVISFLAAMTEHNIAPAKSQRILCPAVEFVLKHQRAQLHGLFPTVLGEAAGPTQFSQCYGDLGVGYGLFRASQVWDDAELRRRTAAVLDACTQRTREGGLTWDSSIYYGASGLAAVWDKLYRLSGNSAFRAAASYWYEQIPAYAPQPEADPFAGYGSRLAFAEKSGEAWHVSFGWGMLGAGISLMKSVRPELPPLDGLLLVV